ncbi:hypothetical protein JQ557_16525 [Bradyrhizobium sp. U87765 SZCCT0131]|uniref:hypothetical protein n=1 Tax=unclassified Bradyrhizobium TaxID=2631580 RepID=UPI001BA4EBD0|nr:MULTISPECIES: hypothetical protein [unclassified Bradyrhizobium]MBR1219613.1 hypothetical protein [Bradyrhizobium sp. U87765 SZCCT0131]MBR1262264.1 hypothetical protein [Bradyrhizobium sp. U87765 SZCCT0134]MBR1308553.1 hypothetical protein [Bradyrhizobium sp. U87765 SZCCT0110]MBR1318046.1 hypothetical protein [Bradyrhizobium sp. U87765 SZCCT0109]MBR1351749.1 hypothetical protein [Bradyrhizobium sp. U87765 SZCCT0048]
MNPDAETRRLIADLSRKYVWWEPIDGRSHSDDRVIAQAMNLATFDDVLRLEQIIGRDRLVGLMRLAEPGWFSERSWEFWRGRLSLSTGEAIADEPPRRALDALAT